MFMVGSALLGAIALGGALAFAYKQSGGAMNGGEPPVVQADARPVKEVPQDAGGKDFPNKNKLIYERLQTGDKPEFPSVSCPVRKSSPCRRCLGSNPTAGIPAGAAPVAPPAVATVDDPEGGPRRVKTLVVRPDGSVMQPPPEAVATADAPVELPPPSRRNKSQAPMAQLQHGDAGRNRFRRAANAVQLPHRPPVAPRPVAAARAPAPAPVAPPPVAAAEPVAADPQPVAAIPAAEAEAEAGGRRG